MSIHIKHKLKTRSLDYRLEIFRKSSYRLLSFLKLNCSCCTCSIDMIDLLFIIGLPFRAMSPNQKMEAALSVQQQNNKMADRSDLIPSPIPPPPSPALLPNFWFLRKRGGSFQIQFMLGEQNNIVWTSNSKLLLNLMVRARKLSELNPI